jgi:hypothetical protein
MTQRCDLARQLERWTGNTAQIVELTSAELDRAVEQGDDLIAALRRDGDVLVGPKLPPSSPGGPPPRKGVRGDLHPVAVALPR